MLKTHSVARLLPFSLLAWVGDVAFCQSFPYKPIRIVTAEAGGGTDFVARLVAQELAAGLGQQVIVDSRPSGAAQGAILVKAAPDGYTLLLNGSNIWLAPLLQDNLPYDPLRDFAPVVLTSSAPHIVAVHPSSPAKSVKELIALAQAKPGSLNYGSSASGGAIHLAAELFKAMADINIVRVNYKGGSLAVNALISGELQVMFPNAPSVTQHVKSGRVRALAVTTAQPSALAPGLPTVAAAGLPGYEAAAMSAIFAPSKTPAALIQRLNQEIVRILNKADVREKLFVAGADAVGSSSEQLSAQVKSDIVKWGKIIKNAGIRGE